LKLRAGPRRACHLILISLSIALAISSMVVSGRADFAVTLASDKIRVQISGDFLQGVPSSLPNTTARIMGYIPFFRGTLIGTNATFLQTLLTRAIVGKSREASVTGLSFAANSNTTTMHYDLNFTVSGVSTTNNLVEKIDLAWRSFAIREDFGIGGVSINRIFPSYLQQNFVLHAQPPVPGPLQLTKQIYVNDQFVPLSQAPSRTQTLLLFNFSSLTLPLQKWATTRPTVSTIMLHAKTGLNVTVIETLTEQAERASVYYDAVNKLDVTVEVPYTSSISNDQVALETGSAAAIYELMIALVIICPAVLFSTVITEKRLSRNRVRRRKAKS
jgi:hypothetical protein